MVTPQRFRHVIFDFHTSEHIPDVGNLFDKKEFASELKRARVSSIMAFAKCHHGWSYYPTQVGVPHPNLRTDLLGGMVEVCKDNDIDLTIYLSVQWDEREARCNPGWRVVPVSSNMGHFVPTWHPLCISNRTYLDRLIAQSREVIELYHPAGILYDILLPFEHNDGSLTFTVPKVYIHELVVIDMSGDRFDSGSAGLGETE